MKIPAGFKPVLHPFLFAIFPALSLLSHNIALATPGVIVKSVAILLPLAFLFFSILTLVLKDRLKAAMALTAFWFFFFSFGQVLNIRYGLLAAEVEGGIIRALLALWAGLYLLIFFFIVRSRRNLEPLTRVFNVIALATILVPSALIVRGRMTGHPVQESPKEIRGIQIPSWSLPHESTPSIFFIILDGFGDPDYLQATYDLDPTAFRSELETLGFSVAPSSHSNYCQTILSLTATLNCSYLQDIPMGGTCDREACLPFLRDSMVVRLAKRAGYATIQYDSGYNGTADLGAEETLSPILSFSEFENLLINFTPVPAILHHFDLFTQFDAHRGRIHFILSSLPSVAARKTPVFVVAHIPAPHPPFVFDARGRSIDTGLEFSFGDGNHSDYGKDPPTYRKLYADQVRFLTGAVVKSLGAIIERSPTAPVILLQGDHGPGSQLDWGSVEKTALPERMGILNACLLPPGSPPIQYTGITPINTMRGVLRTALGASLPPVEDRSYFSTWNIPCNFHDVTDRLLSDTHQEQPGKEE